MTEPNENNNFEKISESERLDNELYRYEKDIKKLWDNVMIPFINNYDGGYNDFDEVTDNMYSYRVILQNLTI